MDNLSNIEGVDSQPGADVNTIEEEKTIDLIQQAKDINKLESEIKLGILELKEKVLSLYNISATKETYDKIIVLDSIQNS